MKQNRTSMHDDCGCLSICLPACLSVFCEGEGLGERDPVGGCAPDGTIARGKQGKKSCASELSYYTVFICVYPRYNIYSISSHGNTLQ